MRRVLILISIALTLSCPALAKTVETSTDHLRFEDKPGFVLDNNHALLLTDGFGSYAQFALVKNISAELGEGAHKLESFFPNSVIKSSNLHGTKTINVGERQYSVKTEQITDKGAIFLINGQRIKELGLGGVSGYVMKNGFAIILTDLDTDEVEYLVLENASSLEKSRRHHVKDFLDTAWMDRMSVRESSSFTVEDVDYNVTLSEASVRGYKFRISYSWEEIICEDFTSKDDCLDTEKCFWDELEGTCGTLEGYDRNCRDPDGENLSVRSESTGFLDIGDERLKRIRDRQEDVCISTTELKEYHCQSGFLKAKTVECEGECENGRCVSDSGPTCGDGVLEEGEECDGSNFGKKSCQDFGLGAGKLTCHNCTINVSECGSACEGCKRGDSCLSVGERIENNSEELYCSSEGVLESQQSGGESCSEDFECASNQCDSGTCAGQGFFAKILGWFGNLF